jgi:hypothetical protein
VSILWTARFFASFPAVGAYWGSYGTWLSSPLYHRTSDLLVGCVGMATDVATEHAPALPEASIGVVPVLASIGLLPSGRLSFVPQIHVFLVEPGETLEVLSRSDAARM